MARKALDIPKFKSESEEADWWASPAGRDFLSKKSRELEERGIKPAGSRLVARLNKKRSVQIAIRLAEADVAEARKIAERKGIGYQTLLKTLVHEGLRREARRG
jgi:predicted DNA binding CopG/RHH family protein